MQKQDLWGMASDEAEIKEVECKFDDSFSPEGISQVIQENLNADEDYVPLEDSSQYLAGLENKLARVQGRTANRRQTESRRLIDALAGSRDTHAHNLLNTNTIDKEEDISYDGERTLQTGAVDPQGTLGTLIRRLVPDKVALTHEELCQLLEADFLAKVQEAATEAEEEEGTNSETKSNNDNERAKNISNESVDNQDDKKLSSDEGEK